jgi:hypothetical protein
MKRLRRSEEGSAIVATAVAVVLCGALSAAVLTINTGREKEAMTDLASMRALNLAESGADWGICQIRINHGVVPVGAVTQTVAGEGKFELQYVQGDDDDLDNNGDGVVDDAGEHDFAKLVSTGTSGGISRSVEVVMRKAIETPAFDGAVQINVEVPILDLNGNSFIVDGREHFLDGTLDPDRPAKYGVSSPANIADVTAQIPAMNADQFLGLGGLPSVGQVAAIDLDKLVDQAMQAAGTLIQPGTHANMLLGTPTESGVVVAYCGGDLHLSGGSGGAGILCVDGDLNISGGFEWVGIVLVRGAVRITGGGATKHVIGALGVGEELGATASSTSVALTGTVDLDYSGDAIGLASTALAITAVMSWREVANPAP